MISVSKIHSHSCLLRCTSLPLRCPCLASSKVINSSIRCTARHKFGRVCCNSEDFSGDRQHNSDPDLSSANQGADVETSGGVEGDESSSFPPYWALLGLSGAGFLETAYLTAVKLTDVPLACPTSGCAPVLQSGYSSLFGIPLSGLGMLGYGAIALLSLQGALGDKYRKEGSLKDMVFFGSVSLSSCSLVLMYILFAKLGGEPCFWCYSSAALSLSILVLCLRSYTWGVKWNEFPMAFMPSAGVAAATIVTLALGFQNVEESIAQDIDLPYQLPAVTEESPRAAVELAKKLSASGVKMFGAFWCTHCYDQKQLFGKQAMEYFPYVECYPEGYRKGVTIDKACEDADVHAFPTWAFGKYRIEGDQEFETLEEALKEYKEVQSQDAAAVVIQEVQ